MILDLTLKENTYVLKVNNRFFRNVSTPLALFQIKSPLMQSYLGLGLFSIEGNTFGFDGCFIKISDDDEHAIYIFDFSKLTDSLAIRKMILTIYLSTYYVVEQMLYHKEFVNDSVWNDQSLSFVVFNGGNNNPSGFAIGGKLYPWFKNKLNFLDEEQINSLNYYVSTEINRIYNLFYGKKFSYGQINITSKSFFIQVSMGGRWISWNKTSDNNEPGDFHSHNIDHSCDQELCFAAITAINTWLREN